MNPNEIELERAEMMRLGDLAVEEAQKENLRKGIPNVYSMNGTLYFQLPDLSITTENPFKNF